MHQQDAHLIVMLSEHPGWKRLTINYLEIIHELEEFILTHRIVNEAELAKHHITVGKLEALKELLNYPDTFKN